MAYSVKIEAFEGPLDLLLHLINRLEIDIYDIPVAQITEQYLRYIHAMRELKLDIASEYLVMAATLLQMKSSMLLPKQEEDMLETDVDQDDEDPRVELMQRLIEYRKYKEAAGELQKYEEERSRIFTRPPENLSQYKQEQMSLIPGNVSVYDMLRAFERLMKRKKSSEPKISKIDRQEVPIARRMTDIINELRRANRRTHFYELFPNMNRTHIVVTFLAILELMKYNQITCEQEGNFDDIYISLREDKREIK